MNKKNLMFQMVNPVNHLTPKDLPVELAELSKEELQQVSGGRWPIIIIPINGSPGPYNPYPRQSDLIF
jgi:bacteriocin-like protein